MIRPLRPALLLLALPLVLAGCNHDERLSGPRFDVRTPLSEAFSAEAPPQAETPENRTAPIRLPKPVSPAAWTHPGGSPAHAAGNLALAETPRRIWSVDIGTGNGKRTRITAAPVARGGLIFAMDARARVSAVTPEGRIAWSRELIPPADRRDVLSGGGLAVAGDTLFATTAYGELVALNAADGAVRWRQKLDAPVTAAPAVGKALVFVVSRDNRAWAIRRDNGRIAWQQQSTTSDLGLLGGAAPALAGGDVFLPFSSGELVSARQRDGLRNWSVAITGGRGAEGLASLGDITGDPVVTGGRVYAANQSGRLTAIARATGERIWTVREGSYNPVLPIGGSVFVVTDTAQLVRLDAATGQRIWSVDLPRWRKPKKRLDAWVHFGPLMVAGRLLVASSDGRMRFFDPVSGKALGEIEIPGGAATPPAVVGNVLYIVNGKGQLLAWR